MKATDFEYRHQTLIHLLVVGMAFLTYTFQPDDIVWALIKHHTIYRTLLERLVFGLGALIILCSAALQTWTTAFHLPGADSENTLLTFDGPYRYFPYPVYFGRLLFAFGIGLLAPMAGTAILLAGEIGLVLRLIGRDRATSHSSVSPRRLRPNWRHGLRKEAPKWGLAVTMVVFTLTLRDRVAEILAVMSFVVWLALRLTDFLGQRERRENA